MISISSVLIHFNLSLFQMWTSVPSATITVTTMLFAITLSGHITVRVTLNTLQTAPRAQVNSCLIHLLKIYIFYLVLNVPFALPRILQSVPLILSVPSSVCLFICLFSLVKWSEHFPLTFEIIFEAAYVTKFSLVKCLSPA